MKIKKERIWEIDFLRGFAILMVIMDHSMYDFSIAFSSWSNSGVALLENLNSLGTSYMDSYVRILWRPAFLFLFFCTSGLSSAFSRNNFLRGIKLAFVAMLVSLVTYYASMFMTSSSFILFGVLHCMAVIILLYSLISLLLELLVKLIFKLINKPFNDNIYKYILSGICLGLSVLFYFINRKYNVGLTDATAYYKTINTDSNLMGLFFYAKNWWTADYFPIFPFISFFFLGASLTQLIYSNKKSLLPSLDGIWHIPFTFPGRHSLSFYIVGQIIVISLCSLLDVILL